MNGYTFLFIILLVVIISGMYDLAPLFRNFISSVTQVPGLDAESHSNPALYTLLIRMMYLIFLLGIARLFLNRRNKD